MRKLFVTSIVVFIEPGSTKQLLAGIFFAALGWGATAYTRPFVYKVENKLQQLSLATITFTLILCAISNSESATAVEAGGDTSALAVEASDAGLVFGLVVCAVAVYVAVLVILYKNLKAQLDDAENLTELGNDVVSGIKRRSSILRRSVKKEKGNTPGSPKKGRRVLARRLSSVNDMDLQAFRAQENPAYASTSFDGTSNDGVVTFPTAETALGDDGDSDGSDDIYDDGYGEADGDKRKDKLGAPAALEMNTGSATTKKADPVVETFGGFDDHAQATPAVDLQSDNNQVEEVVSSSSDSEVDADAGVSGENGDYLDVMPTPVLQQDSLQCAHVSANGGKCRGIRESNADRCIRHLCERKSCLQPKNSSDTFCSTHAIAKKTGLKKGSKKGSKQKQKKGSKKGPKKVHTLDASGGGTAL